MSFLVVYYESADGSYCVQTDTNTDAPNAVSGYEKVYRKVFDGDYVNAADLVGKVKVNNGVLSIDL